MLPITNTLCVKVSGVGCKTLKAPCTDLQQAKEIVQQYIQLNDLGGSTFKGAIVYHPINGAFCHISYNGRIWDGADLMAAGKKEIILTEVNLTSTVKYAEPMADEVNLTFTVIEIEPATNWCKIQANVDMNIKPTYTANISDLITV